MSVLFIMQYSSGTYCIPANIAQVQTIYQTLYPINTRYTRQCTHVIPYTQHIEASLHTTDHSLYLRCTLYIYIYIYMYITLCTQQIPHAHNIYQILYKAHIKSHTARYTPYSISCTLATDTPGMHYISSSDTIIP